MKKISKITKIKIGKKNQKMLQNEIYWAIFKDCELTLSLLSHVPKTPEHDRCTDQWCKPQWKYQYDAIRNLHPQDWRLQPGYWVNRIVDTSTQLDMCQSQRKSHDIFAWTTFAQMHRLIQCWWFLPNPETWGNHRRRDLKKIILKPWEFASLKSRESLKVTQ